MINLLKSDEIKNLDTFQQKVIDFMEKRYELVVALSLISNKKYNPIQLIVNEGDIYQVFLACKGKQGAMYLCCFNDLKTLKPEIIRDRAEDKIRIFSTLEIERV